MPLTRLSPILSEIGADCRSVLKRSLPQIPKIPGLGSFRRKSNEPEVDPLPRKAAQVKIEEPRGGLMSPLLCVEVLLSCVCRARWPGGR